MWSPRQRREQQSRDELTGARRSACVRACRGRERWAGSGFGACFSDKAIGDGEADMRLCAVIAFKFAITIVIIIVFPITTVLVVAMRFIDRIVLLVF